MVAVFFSKIKQRIIDVILSIYLFNEQRGFRYLDQLADIFATKYPQQKEMLQSIRKHAADERKHYLLFCDYFCHRGCMPYATNAWCGYCDQIVKLNFGVFLDELSPLALIQNDNDFFRLCRLIMITEKRGMKQVDVVLHHWLFCHDPALKNIFTIIQKDEPSHCFPYQAWLKHHRQSEESWREFFSDIYINYSLMLWKLPWLVINPWLKTLTEFPSPVPKLSLNREPPPWSIC